MCSRAGWRAVELPDGLGGASVGGASEGRASVGGAFGAREDGRAPPVADGERALSAHVGRVLVGERLARPALPAEVRPTWAVPPSRRASWRTGTRLERQRAASARRRRAA